MAMSCPGPLIWYNVGEHDAILECSHCSYIIVAGSLHDSSHAWTPLLPEGLAR